MKKTPKNDKKGKMTLREIALEILAEEGREMSAHEIWEEAVKRGLDKRSSSHAERPETTMAGFLYRAERDGEDGIVARGEYPVKFRLGKKK